MARLWLPENMRASSSRVIPEWFANALREIDPSLILFFNPIRGRWIIDRCTAAGVHHVSDHQHTNECPRTNVKIIQDEAGQYMPLCQDVLDWLRAHDTWNQHSSAEQFITILGNQDAEYQEKLRAARRDNTHHRTMDHKRQLQKAKNLIDQHDLEVNQ